MPKVVKATSAEIEAYAHGDTLYPLSHWVKVDGVRCAVERLASSYDTDPKYEIILPYGYHDTDDNLHTLLCYDMADVKQRASYCTLTPCNPNCR